MTSFAFFARRLAVALILAMAVPVAAGVASILGAGQAAAAVVSSVSVSGNQRIEAATIRTYITIKPGQSFSAFDIDESIKVLYDTGLFEDVSISQSGSTLVVVVVENPVINSVTFEGNRKVDTNILEQVIESKPRAVMTAARLETDVRRIEDYYSRSGRSSARVQPPVTRLDNNRVDIVFSWWRPYRCRQSRSLATVRFHPPPARVIDTRPTNWLS